MIGLAALVLALPRAAMAQTTPAAPEEIAVGDWRLAPSLEIRTRGEMRRDAPDLGGLDHYGRLSPRVRNQWVLSERARLGVSVTRDHVRAQLTLQDARAFGSAPSATLGGARGFGRFEPYEAFAEVQTSSAKPSGVRVGRQAIVWGEGRLLGRADFSPMGRSLDAVRGRLAFGDFELEALAAILEMPGPRGAAFGDKAGPTYSGVQLYGAAARWAVDPWLHVELFGLARVSRSDGSALDGSRFALARLAGETVTGSLRLSGGAKGYTYGVEGAYQLGHASSLGMGGSDVVAHAVAGHVSKTFPELALSPTFRLAGSYASGDDGSGTYRQFDPILADPQRFHGQMDLFAWSNVVDASARAEVTPWTDFIASLEYRYARLAKTRGEWIGSYLTAVGSGASSPGYAIAGYAPLQGAPDAELGHELDVVLSWRPWAPLELRAGWSGLLLGEGARRVMEAHARARTESDGSLSPARLAQYAYGQATLTMP